MHKIHISGVIFLTATPDKESQRLINQRSGQTGVLRRHLGKAAAVGGAGAFPSGANPAGAARFWGVGGQDAAGDGAVRALPGLVVVRWRHQVWSQLVKRIYQDADTRQTVGAGGLSLNYILRYSYVCQSFIVHLSQLLLISCYSFVPSVHAHVGLYIFIILSVDDVHTVRRHTRT